MATLVGPESCQLRAPHLHLGTRLLLLVWFTARAFETRHCVRRLAVLHDLGYLILVFDIELFLDIFLPPLKSEISVDNILTSLGRGRHITNERWTLFDVDPEKFDGKENEAFQHLENVFDKIVVFAMNKEPSLTQTLLLRLLPNLAPQSERSSRTRPDGFLILKEAEDRIGDDQNGSCHWYDIPCTGEFKMKNNEDTRDNDVTKIVYSVRCVMTVDPCRRFTFGFTIENTSMRLWFCSRGVMAVSTAFNFVTDHRLLARVFLSLAFATKTELGWDPSIEVSDDNGKRVYHIRVGNNVYKVLEVLSEFGADAIIGRATRVFKVELDGKTYVLKDAWVEDDRDLEHVIRDRILRDVESKLGKEVRNVVADHLLTPVDHWLVTVDGQEDQTTNVMMRGNVPPVRSRVALIPKECEESEDRESKGPMMSIDKDVDKKEHIGARAPPVRSRKIQRRRHYRIVFAEVAEPILTLTKLSDVFLVLGDCVQILKYVYECNWVHRNVSAGNVYFYLGRGVLGDLEYAKIVGSGGAHEMRTGTMDFMALEVLLEGYAFLPSNIEEMTVIQRQLAAKSISYIRSAGVEPPPFRHNAAHDLESLWWLALFMLFFNSDASKPETDDKRTMRKECSKLVFPEKLSDSERGRQKFFRNKGEFYKGIAWFPSSFENLKGILDAMRGVLVANYSKFEAAFPKEDHAVFDTLHDAFVGAFDICREQSSGIKYHLSRRWQRNDKKRNKDPPPQ